MPANIWTGAAGDDKWSNPGNWSLGHVPAAGEPIQIGASASGFYITSDSATTGPDTLILGPVNTPQTISIPAGETLTMTGVSEIYHETISGPGSFLLNGGGTTEINGSTIETGAWTISGAETSASIMDPVSGYAGVFTLGAGANLNLGYGNVELDGPANLSDATISSTGPGANTILLKGATSITTGLNIGLAEIRNAATLTQSGGNIVINQPKNDYAAVILNQAGATWMLAEDSGIEDGPTTSDTDSNAVNNVGILEKSGGTGTSTIGVSFADGDGAVIVNTGTLAFSGQLNFFFGPLSGAGAIDFRGGGTTEFWGAAAAVTVAHLSETHATFYVENNLAYGGDFTQTGGELQVDAPQFTLTGQSTLDGWLLGAGELDLSGGGATSIGPDAFLSVGAWSIDGAGTKATIGQKLSYDGAFTLGAGATLAFADSTDYLALGGVANFAGGTISGPAKLMTGGTATTVTGDVTITDGAWLANSGTLTQTGGDVAIGDASGTAATLNNTVGATYIITDDSDITAGPSLNDIFINNGQFEKTGGSATSFVAAALRNSGSLFVDSGTLDLQGAVTGTATDTISGASTMEFDSSVSSGQTALFTGPKGTLDLGSPETFAGSIKGFDASGSNDTLALASTLWSILGYSENSAGTQGVLSLTNGSVTASLNLVGDYSLSNFATSAHDGHTFITYG